MNPQQPSPAIVSGAPLVSIVVPCYREGRFLDDCLTSLRKQTYEAIEIIVVDDGGLDDSLAIGLPHALEDPRVTLVQAADNCGLGATRNLGISLAKGDLVAFVDGDDFLPIDSVETRVAELARQLNELPEAERANVAGIFGDWNHAVEPAFAQWRPPPRRELAPVTFAIAAGQNPFIVSAPLVRTDLLASSGGFCETVDAGEDYLAWLRLLSTGVAFLCTDKIVAIYRQKRASMLRSAGTVIAEVSAAAHIWTTEHLAPDPTAELGLGGQIDDFLSGSAIGDNGSLSATGVRASTINPAIDVTAGQVMATGTAQSPLGVVVDHLGDAAAYSAAFAFLQNGNPTLSSTIKTTLRSGASGTAVAGPNGTRASVKEVDVLLSPTSQIEGYEAAVIALAAEERDLRVAIAGTVRGLEGATQWLMGMGTARNDITFSTNEAASQITPHVHVRFGDWSAETPEAAPGPHARRQTLLKPVGFTALDWADPHAAKRWRTSPLIVQSRLEAALLGDRRPVVIGSPLVEALALAARGNATEQAATLLLIDDSVGSLVMPWVESMQEVLDSEGVDYTLQAMTSRAAHLIPGERVRTVCAPEVFTAGRVITCSADGAFLALCGGADVHYFRPTHDPGHLSVLAKLGVSVSRQVRESTAAIPAVSPTEVPRALAERSGAIGRMLDQIMAVRATAIG